MNEVRQLLQSRHPALHSRIEAVLVESEARYNRGAGQPPSEFLLEHTQRTAAIAHMLDPLPRCATTVLPDAARSSWLGNTLAMYSYDSPWNP